MIDMERIGVLRKNKGAPAAPAVNVEQAVLQRILEAQQRKDSAQQAGPPIYHH